MACTHHKDEVPGEKDVLKFELGAEAIDLRPESYKPVQQGKEKTASHYAPGGMLDSQMDSQEWLDNLLASKYSEACIVCKTPLGALDTMRAALEDVTLEARTLEGENNRLTKELHEAHSATIAGRRREDLLEDRVRELKEELRKARAAVDSYHSREGMPVSGADTASMPPDELRSCTQVERGMREVAGGKDFPTFVRCTLGEHATQHFTDDDFYVATNDDGSQYDGPNSNGQGEHILADLHRDYLKLGAREDGVDSVDRRNLEAYKLSFGKQPLKRHWTAMPDDFE
ncbi:hypothetical protein PENSPDRAFT_751916 [Peniophora sp. CONT]|nr:hypothetical protein PENSPDRAFT_751916 [Peniophora sp. CONT]